MLPCAIQSYGRRPLADETVVSKFGWDWRLVLNSPVTIHSYLGQFVSAENIRGCHTRSIERRLLGLRQNLLAAVRVSKNGKVLETIGGLSSREGSPMDRSELNLGLHPYSTFFRTNLAGTLASKFPNSISYVPGRGDAMDPLYDWD